MDKYSINARTYPVLLFILPIIVIAIVFSLHFENYLQIGISVGITGALAFLFAQIGRDGGKRKEKQLWKEWGGPPTTQLLRWSNDEIDQLTKKRYHDALFLICSVEQRPSKEVEQKDPESANDVYLAWTRFLINNTRDTSKFHLIFRENINYGFRRNLWGMKGAAISLIILLMVGILINHYFQFPNAPIPKTFFIAEGLLLIFLLFWLIKVRKSWVKIPAFAYAHRLLDAVEMIEKK